MLTSIDVKFPSLFVCSSAVSGYKGLFNVGYSTNSSSHPLSSIFNVFPMFLDRNSIVSSSQSALKFPPIYQNN